MVNLNVWACGTRAKKLTKCQVLRELGSAGAKSKNVTWACGAAVAQGTHNPLVVGSNPSGPILSEFKIKTISPRWF